MLFNLVEYIGTSLTMHRVGDLGVAGEIGIMNEKSPGIWQNPWSGSQWVNLSPTWAPRLLHTPSFLQLGLRDA